MGPSSQRVSHKEPHGHGNDGPAFKKERDIPPSNGESITDHGDGNENLIATGMNLIQERK
jgi:hypothetical protein